MQFRFELQPHQATATAAVVDLFDGALIQPRDTLIGQAPGSPGHAGYHLEPDALAENLTAVTSREAVQGQSTLSLLDTEDLQGAARAFPNFSVEMETGTGKTYVYIATALRLAELHGLRKFVILVHSVAIRAGVVKTFEQTAEHFQSRFPALKYRWAVLGEGQAVDEFVEPSSTVQFLVASVQAIDKPEKNSVYQEAEQPQLWGEAMSGISGIAAQRPVVILDEPQNMTTDLRRRAIATLNPLVALRYSATHREHFNLVHRLGPKAASDAGLVKRVSVKGVVAGGSSEPYLFVRKLRSVKKRLMAEVVMEQSSRDGVRRVETVLQNGSDLFEESEELTAYRGMVVDRFERKPDRVFFEDGRVLRVGEEIGVDKTAVWRDQLRHTIRHHLSRQEEVDGTGRSVKVLSLFFVERVHDYVPEEGSEPVLPSMFDELYREEWARSGRPVDDCPDPASLRVHYFPSTKTGIAKDTRNNASDAEFEARAYAEIIANKELLLVKSNPRAFIFSHSALKEGWDNPNVFQVCFLRHTRSDLERRQQIGRGLRLPVDETGVRVTDPSTCRLTLIVDESFADFRDGLNAEYVAAGDGSPGSGGGGGPQPEDADDEIHVRRREDKFVSPEFAELWKRIRFRASYRVTLEASVLPAAIAQSEHLDLVADIAKRANVVQSAELVYDDEGRVTTADNTVAEGRGESITVVGQRLPDLVRLVEDQLLAAKFPLQLTRPTVVSILKALPAKVTRRALDDPDRWARLVASAIRTVTIEEMLNHITYELLAESEWWDAELVFRPDEVVNPPTPIAGLDPSYGVIEAASDGANLFDHLVYDSHVEREYGAYLDNFRDRVRLFTKLPRRFRVRTPVGEYSPDWAIVVGEGVNERVYLVRETKGTLNLDDLEWDEAMRIRFARSHFLAAPEAVNYQVTTSGAGLRLDDSGDTVSDSNV